tara:strand:+ start:601 stop:777 length:177 start_codon:yes stop_codon:yes gene_type:complete
MYKKLLTITGLSLVALAFIIYYPGLNIEMFGDYIAIIGWLIIASILASAYKFVKLITK